jgi:hypothetical protein
VKKYIRIGSVLAGSATTVIILWIFLNAAHGWGAATFGAIFFEGALLTLAGLKQTDKNEKTIKRLLAGLMVTAVILAVYGGHQYLLEEKPELTSNQAWLTAILAGAPFPIINYFLSSLVFGAQDSEDGSDLQVKLLHQSEVDAKNAEIQRLLAKNKQDIADYNALLDNFEGLQTKERENTAKIAELEQKRSDKPSAAESRELTVKQVAASIVSKKMTLKMLTEAVLAKKEGDKKATAEVLGIKLAALNRILEV